MSRVIADGLSKRVTATKQEIKDAYAAHTARQQQEAV
jgi:hypothetical protein